MPSLLAYVQQQLQRLLAYAHSPEGKQRRRQVLDTVIRQLVQEATHPRPPPPLPLQRHAVNHCHILLDAAAGDICSLPSVQQSPLLPEDIDDYTDLLQQLKRAAGKDFPLDGRVEKHKSGSCTDSIVYLAKLRSHPKNAMGSFPAPDSAALLNDLLVWLQRAYNGPAILLDASADVRVAASLLCSGSDIRPPSFHHSAYGLGVRGHYGSSLVGRPANMLSLLRDAHKDHERLDAKHATVYKLLQRMAQSVIDQAQRLKDNDTQLSGQLKRLEAKRSQHAASLPDTIFTGTCDKPARFGATAALWLVSLQSLRTHASLTPVPVRIIIVRVVVNGQEHQQFHS
ncbi:hypothetical protein JKP88DRAFT_243190 [Tribonema minus]|uniref:Uncharacterized protein n=1 Tax=Tribonema minus TaxID=303371 RepID=A0A835ZIP9_9STRA|nr:hypothetical protein JKP88DRAFT_243190 [Tribonema minus]